MRAQTYWMQRLARLLLDRMRMVREDALAVAHVVEEAFQGRSELDDELLGKEVRQVFYDLQDRKILEVRRAESAESGQALRHYFWRVRDAAEDELATDRQAPGPAERLYHRLGEEAWQRRPAPDE